MKKRFLSIFLVLTMVLSLVPGMSLTASADGSDGDEKEWEEGEWEQLSYSPFEAVENEKFAIQALNPGYYGWILDDSHSITLTPKLDNITMITKIMAMVSRNGINYSYVAYSSGNKVETGSVENYDRVHVTDINSRQLTISCSGGREVYINDIIVYYAHDHDFTGGYKDNGDGTHSRQCLLCGESDAAESHTFADGVCGTCGAWDGKGCKEVIAFCEEGETESEHFTLHATGGVDGDGWYVRDLTDSRITITAKSADHTIAAIDAVIGFYSDYYPAVAYSRGNKVETGKVEQYAVVHVTNIYADELVISSESVIQIKDITVYYTHTHDFTGAYRNNWDGTHSRMCVTCDEYDEAESHTFADGVCVCGAVEDVYREVITFNDEADAESEHFTLHAIGGVDGDGWYVRDLTDGNITITAKSADHTIAAIDAVIGFYSDFYPAVAYSSGNKVETGNVENGATVHVTDINSNQLVISSSGLPCQFKDITVYYTIGEKHVHNFTGAYKDNGDGTHSRKCLLCDEYDTAESHVFVDGVCVCGAVEDVCREVIAFNGEADAESEHFTLHETGDIDKDGWWIREDTNSSVTIAAKDDLYIIEGIDAVVGYYGWYYADVVYSSGVKVETDGVRNGDTVHVTDIDSHELTITCGNMIQIKDITVYYTHNHYFSRDCRDNGNGTHSWKCEICDKYGAAESHTFVDGVCICGYVAPIIVGAGETIDLGGETLTVETGLTVNNGGKVMNGTLRIKDGAVVSLGANGGWVPVFAGAEGGYTTYKLYEIGLKTGKDVTALENGAIFAFGYKFADGAAYQPAADAHAARNLRVGAYYEWERGEDELTADFRFSDTGVAKMAEVDTEDLESFFAVSLRLTGKNVDNITARPAIRCKALGFRLLGTEGSWVKK